MEAQKVQFGPDGARSVWRSRIFSAGLVMFHRGVRFVRLQERGRRNALDVQLVSRSFSFPDLPPTFDGFRILHLVSSDDLGMSRQFQQPQQRRGFFF